MKILQLFILIILFSCKSDNTVTIGYQLMANPWKYLIASGQIDQIEGKKVEFKKFNSGAKVINAMASGAIDIAVAGSTPIAAGMSQGLPIKLIWMMEIIGDAEALVVKNEINKLEDLKGKKIGVPYGSTTHFHLMVALNKAGVDTKDLKILNLSPSAIVASWKKNEIDAAFVWAPALEDIKTTGKVLLSSKKLADEGHPTFDGIIARSEFLEKNNKFTLEFLKKIASLHERYQQSPWDMSSEEVKKISSFVGSKPEIVSRSLKGYIFPNKTVQKNTDFNKILKETSAFLETQGKIENILESYNSHVSYEFIEKI